MSRNNVIVVARIKDTDNRNKYYVLHDLNADTEWNEDWLAKKITETEKFTPSRAKALIMAHNIQNKIKTEYGVHEITVKSS